MKVTFLPDGIHHVEAHTQYPDTEAGTWQEHPEVFDDEGLLVMSVGSFLIQTPEHNVLVDAGFGPGRVDIGAITAGAFRGDLIGGEMLESLATVGLTPEDIDGIVLSHLHLDHVGWIPSPSDAKSPTFPNARYFMDTRELAYWVGETDPLERAKGASDEQINLIRRALTTTDGEADIFPGIRVIPTPGHTFGHVSVLAHSDEGRVLVLGDALHCPVELQHRGMAFVFDHDAEQATASRAMIEKLLHEPDTYFAGGHFPNKVFGRLADGDALHTHALHYIHD
ncbi:MBL fold metallo-hydrolase [Rhodococcus sp. NPDC057529]|uniref:MBL fold metallo-hydrolase n=1 Tax=Rhodococcus sp. NPDC057529 TaxID=3346158 RepID=UPI0036710DCE